MNVKKIRKTLGYVALAFCGFRLFTGNYILAALWFATGFYLTFPRKEDDNERKES